MSFNYNLPTYEQNEILYVKYSMNCNNGSLSDKTVIVITKVEQSDLGILYKFRELGTDNVGTFTDFQIHDKFGNNKLIKTDVTLSEQADENHLYAYVRLKVKADKLNDSNEENRFRLYMAMSIIVLFFFVIFDGDCKESVSTVMFIPIILAFIVAVCSIIAYVIGKVKYKKVMQQLELLEELDETCLSVSLKGSANINDTFAPTGQKSNDVYKLNCRNITVKMLIDNYGVLNKLSEIKRDGCDSFRDLFYVNTERLILTASLEYPRKDDKELSIQDVLNLLKEREFKNFICNDFTPLATPLAKLPVKIKTKLIENSIINIIFFTEQLLKNGIKFEVSIT